MTLSKRVYLLCGHYGSGKTNVAVNLALALRRERPEAKLAVADLDIVNPYFRTKDSAAELDAAGIDLIVSDYANSNVDIPALPQSLYRLTDDRALSAVVDVGGDDRGALALGRIAPALRDEGNYEMWAVVNMYRPLTPDAESTIEVLREIECAGGLAFTGIVNDSNLGAQTQAADVLRSVEYADAISEACSLPVVMTCIERRLYAKLEGKIADLFPMDLQKRPV